MQKYIASKYFIYDYMQFFFVTAISEMFQCHLRKSQWPTPIDIL